MSRDYGLYLDDIVEAIDKITEYTAGLSFEQYRADRKTIDAVIRNLEVIGEAAKHIPPSFRKKHPGIPWREMAGMRDKLIHEYFGIQHEIVWKTIAERLPELRTAITQLLALMGGTASIPRV